MKKILKYLCLCPLLSAHIAMADAPRQECLGRLTFDVPEQIEWATFPAGSVTEISQARGGGHAFSEKVRGRGESGSYDYDGLTFYVSDIVERSEFDDAAGYIKGTASLYQKELKKEATRKKKALEELKDLDKRENTKVTREAVERFAKNIEEVERKIPLTKVHEHDLGIPDAHILGSKNIPFHVLLWRNQRVYYFTFSKPQENAVERIKDLVARFRTRELHEVPKGPGVCFPYGFIADDGKTAYEIKNSLRFTRTPNVIFSLLTAAADNSRQTKPTSGIYDTDYRPGYDASKWKKSSFIERTYIGKRLAGLEGWRLDPKPGSGEQERAWFGLAHTGGLLNPLVAVQVFTFQKGTDDLTDFTPPPEEVIPRLKALTETIEQTLDE